MFDKDVYRRDVLDPARSRGNTPPADLLARYALPSSRPAGKIGEQLDEVVAYWRTLRQQKRTYAKLIDALLIEHSKLGRRVKEITWDYLDEETRRRKREVTDRLTRTVDDLAGTTPVISRAAFDRLVADAGGVCSEAQVRKLLADRGVRLVERLWELPDAAPGPYRTISGALKRLGLRLSVDAVVGADVVRRGFRLRDGFRLITAPPGARPGPVTADMVNDVITRIAGRTRDEGKAETDSVLSTLAETAREPERLDALLLWEVMEALRPGLEMDMSAKGLAGLAADLGLVREEAEELALAMRTHGARPAGVAGKIEEALQDGRLREAERLLPGLPEDTAPELRVQVEQQARQVDEWLAEATREQAAGHTETAAELLDRARRTAADDEAIGGRLHALPPPPPAEVRVGARDGRVTVSWTPGPVRVGPVRYRVVRAVGTSPRASTDGTRVGETDANELVDSGPPAAEELRYGVLAARAEGIWSAPAVGPPVTLLPEVEEPSVVAAEREVTVTWRLPAGAAGAEVTRLADDGAERRVTEVDRGGFVDDDVTAGLRYRYRVKVRYERADGRPVLSPGILLTALPEGRPRAVPDLSVDLLGGSGPPVARIGWTAPESGRVMIRTADGPPPWPPGTLLAASDVERYGREVPGAVTPVADGRMTLRAPVRGGARGHFVAITVGAGKALVGPSAKLVVVDPVRDLQARRAGDIVRLSWIWPDDVRDAEVLWAPVSPTGSALDHPGEPDDWTAATLVECTRRGYEDDGFRLDVGPGPVVVGVRTVVRDGGTLRSRAVVTGVPGRPADVRYRFRRGRWPRSPYAVLELTADRPCRLPPLIVVRSRGQVIILRPDQGEVIHEVPARDLDPAVPFSLRIPLPPGPAEFRLACFVAPDAAGDGAAVTLVPDPGSW